MYRCITCGLAFRYPCLSEDEYHKLYWQPEAANWTEEGARPDWDRVLIAAARYLNPQSRVLDIGCSTGGLMERLSTRYQVFGVEPNQSAREEASARTGARVESSIDAFIGTDSFDAVVLCDVIEHIPNPASLLRTIEPLLSRTGLVLISTGDAGHAFARTLGSRWWYAAFPEHVSFISRRWIRRLDEEGTWSTIDLQNFSRATLSSLEFAKELIGVGAYAISMPGYIRVVQRRNANRQPSPPGIGLANDHILAVLRKRP